MGKIMGGVYHPFIFFNRHNPSLCTYYDVLYTLIIQRIPSRHYINYIIKDVHRMIRSSYSCYIPYTYIFV